MNYLVPDYYKKFQCIGKDCSRNCCQKGWGIAIDDDSYQRYMAMEGDWGRKLRENIEECEDGHRFKLDESGSCPFLTKDRLCGIYIELGPEQMNYVCATYPRQYRQYADLMESNLKISCPEAARLLLSHKEPISFIFAESDDSLYIDVDRELFDSLFLARSMSIDIMQFRSLDLWKRAALTVLLAQQLQELMDQGIQDLSAVLQEFNSAELFEEKLSTLEQALGGAHEDEPKHALAGYFITRLTAILEYDRTFFSHYLDLFDKYIGSEQYSLRELEREFDIYYKDNLYQYENFFVYWLFQHYICSMEKKNLYPSISVMIFNYFIAKILGILTWLDHDKRLELEDQVEIFSHLSLPLEHSSELFDELYDILKEKRITSVSSLTLLVYS